MKTQWSVVAVLVLGALAPAGCRRADSTTIVTESAAGPAWFEEVTVASGLDFVHDAGPDPSYFMPRVMGSGAAVFDCDGDGLLDLLFLNNGGAHGAPCRLYRQDRPGHFTDATVGSGLDIAGWCMGVAVGDVNNDGAPDVVITQFRGIKLFLNKGDGTFVDATEESGLTDSHWGMSAAFLDFDRDGWLDLIVVDYLDFDPSNGCAAANGAEDFCAPARFQGTPCRLFRNRGLTTGDRLKDRPAVSFEDVSQSSAVGRIAAPGLGVVCADFDGDGWPDIFVANDGRPNSLWINQRNGTFVDDALRRGVALNAMGKAEAGMGVALGDVDGDGSFGLAVTHLFRETHGLWRQKPRGLFTDRSASAGLAAAHGHATGFGVALADFDDDGYPDLAIAAGAVFRGKRVDDPRLKPFWRDYAEHNLLFRNHGLGGFRDLAAANPDFCGSARVSRGLVAADLFNDGSLSLLTTEIAGPARLYRNIVPNRGHWLRVRAVDPVLHRDAYGAEIVVVAAGRRRFGLVEAAGSYLCSGDPRPHFGLGNVDHYEAVEVRWPDGNRELFPAGPADTAVELRKGLGRPAGL